MTMTYPVRRSTPEDSVLKQAFDRYEDESVTDEQVERVLAPVLAMIKEGAFDRPKRKRFEGLPRSFATVAAAVVLVLVVAVAPWKRGGQAMPTAADNGPVVISDAPVPLAAPPTVNILSGRVLYSNGTAGEVTLRLVDANTWETVAETRAALDGSYVFSGFPDGTYSIEVTPPGGDTYTATAQSGGQADELTFGQETRAMEGVDITV